MSILTNKKLSAGLKSILFVLLLGGIVGYLGGPAIVLVLWGLLALAIGVLCISPRVAALDGALYGFVLAYVFMVAGYTGTALSSKLLIFGLFGVGGAIWGAILALAGFGARKLLKK